MAGHCFSTSVWLDVVGDVEHLRRWSSPSGHCHAVTVLEAMCLCTQSLRVTRRRGFGTDGEREHPGQGLSLVTLQGYSCTEHVQINHERRFSAR